MTTKRSRRKFNIFVDGDMFAFRAASAAEHEICWGEDGGLWTLHSFMADAVGNFHSIAGHAYDRIKDKVKQERLPFTVPPWPEWAYCFSDSEKNFRKDILSTYKANRAGKRKPVAYYALLQDYIYPTFRCKWIPTLEADDVLGLSAAVSRAVSLIISGDKDLKQVPGWHYDFIHEDLFYVAHEETEYYLFMQVLTGDTTDGYGGCPGIGPKKAEELLGVDCSWQTVVKAYESKGLAEEEALTQARVAYILNQKEDYDRKERSVRLWTPTV